MVKRNIQGICAICKNRRLIDEDKLCEDCYYELPENKMKTLMQNLRLKLIIKKISSKLNKKYKH
jgi:hypothetical protein